MDGKVTYFNRERGFGFIRTDGEPDDLFFHISDVEDPGNDAVILYPEPGERVSFEIGSHKRGKAAKNVKVIKA